MSIFNKVHWWGADLLPGSIHTLLQGDYAAWVGSGWQHSEEISQFNSKEKTGAWRRLEEGGLMGWRVGDYRGGLSWHKHDNIQEAWSPFNTAASALTTNRQLPVRGSAEGRTEDECPQTTRNEEKTTIGQIDPTWGWQQKINVLKIICNAYVLYLCLFIQYKT